MADQIVVSTHNGELPKDGGKRQCYVAGGFLMIPGVPGRHKIITPPPPPEKPVLVYSSIARINPIGNCPCGAWPDKRRPVKTDEGMKILKHCGACNSLLRPRW